MIIASSSPTIIQKESTDSGTSTLVSNVNASPVALTNALVAAAEPVAAVAAAEADLSSVVDHHQTTYDLSRHSNPLANAAQGANQANVLALALAVAAANDPAAQVNAPLNQLPTVSTQLALDTSLASGSSLSGASQPAGHAPLNATNTMKPSGGSSATSTPRKSASASG